MFCKYCGKECKNPNSLHNHERLCASNPNKDESNLIAFYNTNSDIKHKNRYTKAKENGIKYEDKKETLDKLSKSFKGNHHTEYTKQKISNSRKKYLEDHPEQIGWKINHSSKMSYPEKYFLQVFEKEGIPVKYHKYIGRYELDFYNENFNKYIEIDGEQHFSDKMILHDKIRTEYLENLGWKGIRVRWSDFVKLSCEEKRSVISSIKDFIGKN